RDRRGRDGGRVAAHAGRLPARADRELPDVGASMVTNFAHPLTPEGPMSKKSAKKLTAREARLAEAREQQRATERRRAMLLTVATGLVIAVIVGAVAWAIVGEKDEREAGGDLSAVQEFDYDGQQHVEGKVDYEESPPVGGEHNPAWLNCGVYDEPVPNEHAVHSLEHGTVWIT